MCHMLGGTYFCLNRDTFETKSSWCWEFCQDHKGITGEPWTNWDMCMKASNQN